MRRAAKISLTALLVALSVVGSFATFPSPAGTIALDSSPGFFAAFFLGPTFGAVVCAMGHLATSVVHAFPLGILHIFISAGMAFTGFLAGVVKGKLGLLLGAITAVVVNTALFPLAVPVLGWYVSLYAVMPILLVASSVNALIAALVFKGLTRALKF